MDKFLEVGCAKFLYFIFYILNCVRQRKFRKSNIVPPQTNKSVVLGFYKNKLRQIDTIRLLKLRFSSLHIPNGIWKPYGEELYTKMYYLCNV